MNNIHEAATELMDKLTDTIARDPDTDSILRNETDKNIPTWSGFS